MIKCKICKYLIPENTEGRIEFCECLAIAVHGFIMENGKPFYRVLGNKEFWEIVDEKV